MVNAPPRSNSERLDNNGHSSKRQHGCIKDTVIQILYGESMGHPMSNQVTFNSQCHKHICVRLSENVFQQINAYKSYIGSDRGQAIHLLKHSCFNTLFYDARFPSVQF